MSKPKAVKAIIFWDDPSLLHEGDESPPGWRIDWTLSDGRFLPAQKPLAPLYHLRQDAPQAALVDAVHLSAENEGFRYGGCQIGIDRGKQ